MKKQFNFYMDTKCKTMIEMIRQHDINCIQGLSDSQVVEYVLRRQAIKYGFKDDDNFDYINSLRVK